MDRGRILYLLTKEAVSRELLRKAEKITKIRKNVKDPSLLGSLLTKARGEKLPPFSERTQAGGKERQNFLKARQGSVLKPNIPMSFQFTPSKLKGPVVPKLTPDLKPGENPIRKELEALVKARRS